MSNPVTVSDGKVVSIHYTLTASDGKVLDKSGAEPMAYLHGRGNVVPGLEREIAGKSVGDKFRAVVEPEDAYGSRNEDGVRTLPRDVFPEGAEFTPGEQFGAQTDSGKVLMLTVVRAEDDKVVVDTNHPLAGETLTFDIEVAEIREATAEETAHGHVHDGGCHH
jgi:FKBP-type peptidyl-prolyl cis-trans isomerase SlyD